MVRPGGPYIYPAAITILPPPQDVKKIIKEEGGEFLFFIYIREKEEKGKN